MALKILINNKKIGLINDSLSELREKLSSFDVRSEELERDIDESSSNDDLDVVKEEIEKLLKEKEEIEKKIKELEEEKNTLEEENKEIKDKDIKGNNKGGEVVEEAKERVQEVISYIRSKGQTEVRAGLKSSEVGVLIPKEIVYKPKEEVNTVSDLSRYITKTKVNTSKGTYPVINRNTAKLATVQELEANPELAKPQFTTVDWSVDTYRGAILLSQEAIEDSEVDLLGIIDKTINEIKVNTTNAKIAEVLKSFTARDVKGIDDFKKIINVDLDVNYSKNFVVSQSFYQVLDTMKDKNDKYILNDNITVPSGKTLLGCPLIVVNDTLLGNAGDCKAFVGDLSQAVLYVDRKEIGVRWADNGVYGTQLMVGLRFGIKKVDDKAGYFVTFKEPAGASASR